MLKKTAWIVATGLLAYGLEYGLGLRELPTRYLLYVIFVPLIILYAIDFFPSSLSGRLKAAKSLDSATPDSPARRDLVFEFSTIIYVCSYLFVLLRIRPRDWDLVREIILVLSPVELFWLVAPVVVFWWYRKQVKTGKET